MTTALDLIKQALKAAGILGIGQDPLAEDVNDGLYQLNLMITNWRAGKKRFLIYHLLDLSVVSTGATQYTIGPGGDINTGSAPRPNRLRGAFVRQVVQAPPWQPDYPLEIINSMEDWSAITIKQQTSIPMYIFYDSAFPLGVLHPWPLPLSGVYELHVLIQDILSSFPALTTQISLPDGYEEALFWNLAVRLATLYKIPLDPRVDLAAKNALDNLRAANAQIPQLSMPRPLTTPGVYNPYSDQVR